MQVPKRRSEQERLARQSWDRHLTSTAIAGLRRELEDLKDHQRPRLAEETQRMREMGDLSENAGYQTAKAQLTRVNFRILEIEDALKHAIVIERGTGGSGRIRIGSIVTIRSGDRTQTLEILGSQESDPSRGRISHASPIGQALLGHVTGDAVEVVVRGKSTSYVILGVE